MHITLQITWFCSCVYVIIFLSVQPSASLINFIWNDHECKILFIIIWQFQMGFYGYKSWHYFIRKHNVVTDGIMTLRASNHALCNVWSYDFYDMTLSHTKLIPWYSDFVFENKERASENFNFWNHTKLIPWYSDFVFENKERASENFNFWKKKKKKKNPVILWSERMFFLFIFFLLQRKSLDVQATYLFSLTKYSYIDKCYRCYANCFLCTSQTEKLIIKTQFFSLYILCSFDSLKICTPFWIPFFFLSQTNRKYLLS